MRRPSLHAMVRTGTTKRRRHTPGVSAPASSRLSPRQELVAFVVVLLVLVAVVYAGLRS